MDSTLDGKLDKLYDSIDDLFRREDFEGCNRLLAGLKVSEIETDLLIGYLTATLPAKSGLPYRGLFYKEVENTIKERGHFRQGLLDGLN